MDYVQNIIKYQRQTKSLFAINGIVDQSTISAASTKLWMREKDNRLNIRKIISLLVSSSILFPLSNEANNYKNDRGMSTQKVYDISQPIYLSTENDIDLTHYSCYISLSRLNSNRYY